MAAREAPTPDILDVAELPESEKGAECRMVVGEDEHMFCGNPVEYVFVYDGVVDDGGQILKNARCCADCRPGVTN